MRSFSLTGLAAGLLLAVLISPGAQAAPSTLAEPGVSQALALARAARLSDLHYALNFQLAPHAATIPAHETLTFIDSGSGDLPLDYRDGTVTSATLNGKAIPLDLADGHLLLPAAALTRGKNTLTLAFTSQAAPAGKAITRYEDRDDHNEYIYTLFVPMDASMAFPCFDQPDLKGRFSLQVLHPTGWTVIANTAPSTHTAAGKSGETIFPESQPISTYLFAFAAGPFASIAPAHVGEPTLYVRQSQRARAQAEAPQVQQMTARGVQYLEDYFARPFPFPKYDLVLIPGFPFGGMEHAGATFLNEDSVLFRTAPTQSDYFRRNILVLHETCHQWFGDLVTMKWFNDLWLKEGFAQYMAYKALARLEPGQNPWKHFYEDIKPLAYGIDETQGTTPIFQHIPNLKDAKSAYGAIVYQKAPAVLKQLNYFLGEQNFRDGLRLYLKQHAYANAQWEDLIAAFSATGKQDVPAWANAWILQRGMPQVESHQTCAAGRITSFTLTQKDVLGTGHLWPITNQIALIAPSEPGIRRRGPASATEARTPPADVETLRVSWRAASYPVREAIGRPCPSLVLTNEDDFAYGRFLLDPPSATTAAFLLNPNSPREPNPGLFATAAGETHALRRSMLYGALWENVHIAEAAPAGYLDLVLATLPGETDESLNRIQGARVATSLHAYLADARRASYTPRFEALTSARMLHAPTLQLRIVNFRAFTSIAETPSALAQVRSLLDGTLSVPGMPLKPLDRWNLIGHLIAMGDPEAPARFAAEKARDHSGEGQKYAYAVEAGSPSAAMKARYFDEYLHSADRPEDWITQSLQPFNSWNQAPLTASFLAPAQAELPEIKRRRKIFFLNAWLGSFVASQTSPEAQSVVHTWLAQPGIDPDLRLKVLEVSDALDRTVNIRRRFSE